MDWLNLLGLGDQGWSDELLRGAWLSIEISLSAYLIGLVLGLLGAIAKQSESVVARSIAGAYTTIIRSVPDILVIFLVYYSATDALSYLIGMTGQFQLSGFVAAALSLGVVQGGYSTEVLRGAINAVSKGQNEAAFAMGLTRKQAFFLVIIPQMLPLALPGLGNLWLVVLKESSLVSLIGFTELVLAGKMAAGATRHYLLFYAAVGAVFLIMSGISALVFHAFEMKASHAWRRK